MFSIVGQKLDKAVWRRRRGPEVPNRLFMKGLDSLIWLYLSHAVICVRNMGNSESVRHWSSTTFCLQETAMCQSQNTKLHSIHWCRTIPTVHRKYHQLLRVLVKTPKIAHDKIPKANVNQAGKRFWHACLQLGRKYQNIVWNHMVFRIFGQIEQLMKHHFCLRSKAKRSNASEERMAHENVQPWQTFCLLYF